MCILKIDKKDFHLIDCEKGRWITRKTGNKIIGFLSDLKFSNVGMQIRLEQCVVYYNSVNKIVMYEINKKII